MNVRKHLVDAILLGSLGVLTLRAIVLRLPKVDRLEDASWSALVMSPPLAESGDSSARVLVEFLDYQCPYCARVESHAFGGRLLDSLGIRRIVRHYPLPYHAHAMEAAVASECMQQQVGRDGQVHSVLLAHQDSLGKIPWGRLAVAAGARDSAAFGRCVADPKIAALIQNDIALAKRVGVTGTPAFYLDRTKIPSMPVPQLMSFLRSPKESLTLRDFGSAIASFF
jgi:protein-disulfide isomerase